MLGVSILLWKQMKQGTNSFVQADAPVAPHQPWKWQDCYAIGLKISLHVDHQNKIFPSHCWIFVTSALHYSESSLWKSGLNARYISMLPWGRSHLSVYAIHKEIIQILMGRFWFFSKIHELQTYFTLNAHKICMCKNYTFLFVPCDL